MIGKDESGFPCKTCLVVMRCKLRYKEKIEMGFTYSKIRELMCSRCPELSDWFTSKKRSAQVQAFHKLFWPIYPHYRIVEGLKIDEKTYTM